MITTFHWQLLSSRQLGGSGSMGDKSVKIILAQKGSGPTRETNGIEECTKCWYASCYALLRNQWIYLSHSLLLPKRSYAKSTSQMFAPSRLLLGSICPSEADTLTCWCLLRFLYTCYGGATLRDLGEPRILELASESTPRYAAGLRSVHSLTLPEN